MVDEGAPARPFEQVPANPASRNEKYGAWHKFAGTRTRGASYVQSEHGAEAIPPAYA